MGPDKFEKIVRDFFEKNCILLIVKKAGEYARGNDILHNFKKAGRRRGKSPEEALAGMQEKHRTSIDDMLQDLEARFQKEGPDMILTNMEISVWEEKLRDDICYSFLLWGLLLERRIFRNLTVQPIQE